MPFVVYSLLRVGLLLAAIAALYVVGMRSWLLVLVATVLALTLSYVLLGRQRDAAASWVATKHAARRARGRRPDADTQAEDAEIDRVRGEDG